MDADLVFLDEARADIDEAYAWYEAQRPGRVEDFLERLEACIRGLLRFPEMHAVVHEPYGRALVRRFPYAVFYEYQEGTVTVFAVFHTARDPDKWRGRLL